jgi:hypothetical protein
MLMLTPFYDAWVSGPGISHFLIVFTFDRRLAQVLPPLYH